MGVGGKYPLFYWNSIQAHDFKHISRIISNLSIERAAELKKYSSATLGMLFCPVSILLTIYAYKKGGGGSRKMTWWQGEGGSGYSPKVMTAFMNSPLLDKLEIRKITDSLVSLISLVPRNISPTRFVGYDWHSKDTHHWLSLSSIIIDYLKNWKRSIAQRLTTWNKEI